MKNLLIVEDDDFKYRDIIAAIDAVMPNQWLIERAGDVHSAVELMNAIDFYRVVVDMAIPSHPSQRGAGTALNLAIGGHEVIFEMDLLGRDGRCVVLTQYPEIEIEQTLIPVNKSKATILEKFECTVIACIQYSEELDWKKQLAQALA